MRSDSNTDALSKLTQIIHAAAHAGSVEEQVQQIVDGVSSALGVDVCSLYKRLPDSSLMLAASHGLIKKHPVVLPPNTGLVGQVLAHKQPVNLIHPAQHPAYYHVAESQEENFQSFCAVPLIHKGEVNGVLVVQSLQPQYMSSEQLALLTTLATHLSLLMSSLATSDSLEPVRNHVFHGISGSPGIAISKAMLVSNGDLQQVQRLTVDDVEQELLDWQTLVDLAKHELHRERQVIGKTMGESLAAVLDAYSLFLQDAVFQQAVEREIKSGFQLPWALKQAVNFFSEQFKSMDDAYLQARHEDIEQLGKKLYQLWQGNSTVNMPQGEDPVILVGAQISISDIAQMDIERIAGFVCYAGASLSHVAVLANALGIPAVMAVGELPLQTGDELIVDGDGAQVICLPIKQVLAEYKRARKERRILTESLLADTQLPAVTTDNHRVTLLANTGLQSDVKPGLRFGAEGIGLYRTEIPFIVRSSLPSEEEQEQIYRGMIEQYQGKKIYFRTLDIGSDKPLPYLPLVAEDNPALGWRGIRHSLDHLPLFSMQLRAILKASGAAEHMHILLPMLSSTEQLDECLALIAEIIAELEAGGHKVNKPKLGVMVEVPACSALLPFWRDKIDFISIGTNDLSQYLLALDRNNPLVGKWYDALHPSVIHEVKRIVDIAKAIEMPVSVCGEMASNPVAVLILMGMGVQQLSMSAAKIPLIKALIRAVSVMETQSLLADVLLKERGLEIRNLGNQFIQSKNLAIQDLLVAAD